MNIKPIFEVKNYLFSWIYGVIWEDHQNRSLATIVKLIDDCETNGKSSIKSTITVDENTYVFEMRLSK